MSREFLCIILSSLLFASFGLGIVLPTESGNRIENLKRASFSGQATYFNVGLGSCGKTNKDSDLIVALAPSVYAKGSHCDQKIQITDPSTGKTATAMVRDTCPGCEVTDLDMSPSLFGHFAPLEKGVFNVNWSFI